jgi:hypothetical protein
VLFAIGNIGQYLYFAGRIGTDAARYTERERELENGYASLERELEGERSRQQEASRIVSGIEEAIDRTGGKLQDAIGLVRTVREEIKRLEACLNN